MTTVYLMISVLAFWVGIPLLGILAAGCSVWAAYDVIESNKRRGRS